MPCARIAGELIWRHRTKGDVITAPTVYSNGVFVAVDGFHIWAACRHWRRTLGATTRTTDINFFAPAVYNGVVYAATGGSGSYQYSLIALDAGYGVAALEVPGGRLRE